MDREKVIKGLECCLPSHDPDCDLCPYASVEYCRKQLLDETIKHVPTIDAIPLDWLNDVIADGDERISKAAVIVKRQWEWERRMKCETGKPV